MQTVTLNNGVPMPILGFGVFQIPAEQTEQAVTGALAAGYRHLDTAASYGNKEAVGRAIKSRASPARSCSSPPSCGSRPVPARRPSSAPSTRRCSAWGSATSTCT